MTTPVCPRCGGPRAGAASGQYCPRCAGRLLLDLTELPADEADSPARVPVLRLGEYELGAELGRGAMGVVYRARQPRLTRQVAVKVILASTFAGESARKRFLAEAELAAQLDHPNIVPIYEVGETTDGPFYVMKLVEGGTLAQRMRSGECGMRNEKSASAGPPKTPHSAFRIPHSACLLAKIARAIHHAHQRGVLHRDLKPGNILIDAQGEPHVADFGLARQIGVESSLTQTGSALGTPAYMAPEQAAGERGITTAADVWSLGAIFFQLLAGRPPFTGENIADILLQARTQEPPSLRALNAAVPCDLETICRKCLEKDPSRRYGSALALAEDLERWLNHEPIRARPTSSGERLVKWARRNPARATLATALLLMSLVAITGIAWQWRRAERHATAEAGQRRQADAAVTRLEIEKAENFFAADDAGRGLAYLARLLRREPTNRVVAERLLSALSQRNFCLPAAPALAHDPPMPLTFSPWKNQGQAPLPFIIRVRNPIRTAEFSQDGQRIVTAGQDGTARLWDAHTGLPVCPPLRHESWVRSAQFSPDGKRVVSASLDRTARLWDAENGTPLLPPLAHAAAVFFAAFDPGGGKVVTTAGDMTVQIWDARTGQPLGTPFRIQAIAYCASFSPNGEQLLIGAIDGMARLLDANSGAEIAAWTHVFTHADHTIPSPQFSPNGERVLTMGLFDGSVWSVRSPARRDTSAHHEGEMALARFSPDGQLFATASHDNTARVWDADSREAGGQANPGVPAKPLAPPLKHEDWVGSVNFSPDQQRLATASKDRSARIWDVPSGRPLTESLRHDVEVSTAQFSPSGQHLLTVTTEERAWIWEIRHAKPVAVVLPHIGPVHHVAFSPDGRRIATADTRGGISVWDSRTGERLLKSDRGAGFWRLVRFSPDGTRLLTASSGNTAEVWDATLGESVSGPFTHRGRVFEASFSPDGTRVVTASSDGTACIWNAANGKRLLKIKHPDTVGGAAFSPDGKRVVTASHDKTARIWDAATGEPLTEPLLHDDSVHGAAFSPDGTRVLTASQDKTVRIWDARSGTMLTPPVFHADELYRFNSAQFSFDGARVATAAGSAAQVWDARTGQPITPPLKHAGRVHSVRFSPDGRRLATACYDGTVRIFDLITGHALSEPLRHDGPASYAEFSPDGLFLATASYDGAARIWEVPQAPMPVPEWLSELAEAVAGQKIDAQGMSSMVPVTKLFELKQRLRGTGETGLPPAERRRTNSISEKKTTAVTTANDMASASNYYNKWVQWFFQDGRTRTLSPSSPVTTLEYVQRCISENSVGSLQNAVRLSPDNQLAQTLLALAVVFTNRPPTPAMVAEMDLQSARAVKLAPGDAAVWWIRALVCERLGRRPDALKASDRASSLDPTNPTYGRVSAGLPPSTQPQKLMIQFTDPSGDVPPGADLTTVSLKFDTADGQYTLTLNADPTNLFNGHFRVNVNFYNPDVGTLGARAFFTANISDFSTTTPTNTLVFSGKDHKLTQWRAGDRVAANSRPFGTAWDGDIFHTGLQQISARTVEDVLGAFHRSDFAIIRAADTAPR